MGAVRPSIPTGKFVILNRINTKGETVIGAFNHEQPHEGLLRCVTILQGGKLDKEVLATAIKDIFENRGTRHEDNHPLFSEAFRNSPDKLAQWSAFLRKTKINNGPSFATVMDLLGKELKPYWEGLEIK